MPYFIGSWKNLLVNVSKNCFSPFPPEILFCTGVGLFSSGDVGSNAIIKARYNNISGYGSSVIVDGTMNVDARCNYWTENGPVNVLSFGPGIVNVANYLTEHLDCPKFEFCCPVTIPDTNRGNVETEGKLTPNMIKHKIQEFKKLL